MKRTGIEGCRDFLTERDGEADLLNRRLANREQFFSDSVEELTADLNNETYLVAHP